MMALQYFPNRFFGCVTMFKLTNQHLKGTPLGPSVTCRYQICRHRFYFKLILQLAEFSQVYNDELRKILTENYYTILQGRCQEEQHIMTTPWHLTYNIENLKYI